MIEATNNYYLIYPEFLSSDNPKDHKLADALESQDYAQVLECIEKGAQFDPNLSDQESQRIFKKIALNADLDILQKLIEMGCATFYESSAHHTSLSYTSMESGTLLQLAFVSGNLEKIRYASQFSHSIDACASFVLETDDLPESFEKLKLIEQKVKSKLDLFFELGGDWSNTKVQLQLLSDAAYNGYEDIFLELILKKPLIINQKQGNSLLGIALTGYCPTSRVFDKLASFGFNHSELKLFAESVNRPLHSLVLSPAASDFLLKVGCSVDEEDSLGRTALFYIDSKEHSDFLIQAGANPNHEDHIGETPLFGEHFCDTITSFIENGANLNHKNIRGETALFSPRIYHESIKFLVKSGLNPNETNHKGLTPLMVQALNYEKNYFCLRLVYLIESGADPKLKNLEGKTALDLVLEERERLKQSGLYEKMQDERYALERVIDCLKKYS